MNRGHTETYDCPSSAIRTTFVSFRKLISVTFDIKQKVKVTLITRVA